MLKKGVSTKSSGVQMTCWLKKLIELNCFRLCHNDNPEDLMELPSLFSPVKIEFTEDDRYTSVVY